MSYKKKFLTAILFGFSLLTMSGCSIAGIKVIEKSDVNAPVEQENNNENVQQEEVRTFKHAGYVFKEVSKTLYITESTPAMDSLEEEGTIVRSLVPGEAIEVIGIDAGKEYAVFKDGKEFLYVSMKSLSDEKTEDKKPKKNEIIDKEELDITIKECKKILKDEAEYKEEGITALRKVIVEAEKIFQDVEVKQTEVDSAVNSLMKAKRNLEKEEEPEEPEEPKVDDEDEEEETEEPVEVKTEVIQEKIDQYEKVLEEDREEYTEESLKAYDEAMAKMKKLLEKETVTAEEVKKITMELDRAIAGLKLKKETDAKEPAKNEGLGIPYPSAPDSVDIFGGVTFAILKDVKATVAVDGKVYELSSAESKEIGNVKKGDAVKVLAIGTNDFARIEFAKGKVGFIKSAYLKKN